jgi:hypothetical protein
MGFGRKGNQGGNGDTMRNRGKIGEIGEIVGKLIYFFEFCVADIEIIESQKTTNGSALSNRQSSDDNRPYRRRTIPPGVLLLACQGTPNLQCVIRFRLAFGNSFPKKEPYPKIPRFLLTAF